MATRRTDVSGELGAPTALAPAAEAAVEAVDGTLLRVPDVRLCSEAAAIAAIEDAGLVPGERCPRPRPRSGRAEVVVRTLPRAGTLVPRGTRIDFDIIPGDPRDIPASIIDQALVEALADGADEAMITP
jgi:beta-lactam-binding protein with PASTA domain